MTTPTKQLKKESVDSMGFENHDGANSSTKDPIPRPSCFVRDRNLDDAIRSL